VSHCTAIGYYIALSFTPGNPTGDSNCQGRKISVCCINTNITRKSSVSTQLCWPVQLWVQVVLNL